MTNIREKVMREMYYRDWYKTWIRNFAINLNDIWSGKSAKILTPMNFQESSTAIVIGKGPSIKI